ncbi:RNA methyltransferase [Nocardioides dongkuii]|uniref:RNA methyltransferase n=1 Tax=Nocardioides dongkuii TaxID=2760089 RepID=UPI0018775E93|nr:RNA methyltransferase [Nocardioides dongkuii]
MTYDGDLAARIRAAVDAAAGPDGYREIAMFGGLCWTVNTHMAVGTGERDLMVHVGTDGVEAAIARGARRATMGERTMGGVVLVAAADLPDPGALDAWVGPAVERARARPPKAPKAPRTPRGWLLRAGSTPRASRPRPRRTSAGWSRRRS